MKYTKEKPIEHYVCKYIQKRLANAHKTDLGSSQFYEDIFHWDLFLKYKTKNAKNAKGRKTLGVGHLFRLSRIRKMSEKHQSYLTTWLSFIDKREMKSRTDMTNKKANASTLYKL